MEEKLSDRNAPSSPEPAETQPAAPPGARRAPSGATTSPFGPETLPAARPALVGTVRGDLAPGTRLDAYTVLGVLGRGGMGVVYRAEQHQPRRIVALKLLRPGLTTAELLARFAFEVQALGRLQHPGIAHVFEAGTIDAGDGPQPFFAMELIEGRPLSAYIADHRHGLRERLELLTRICDAVQHAHTKGVIHRDLKPANILVVDEVAGALAEPAHEGEAGPSSLHHGGARPKVLDFGVARVTGAQAPHTLATTVGQLVGTVPYMSPEQIGGDSRELDTRTDVYSLGVILYEMLAGRLPHDLAHKPLVEAARIIREVEPPRLTSVNPALPRDLDWITARALDKDRAHRYQSAGDLAADLRRFLADQPVLARPPTTWYLFRKFSRRNKTLVLSCAALAVAVVAGLAVTSSLLAWALRAEHDAGIRLQEALDARATESAVNEFLNEMLASVDPARGARELTVREALERAASRVHEKFARRPVVEAAVRETIGRSYRALGLFAEAEAHHRAAYELRRRELGETDARTLGSLNDVASAVQDQSRLDEAETLFRSALPLFERVHGPAAPDTLMVKNNLAMLLVMRGNYPEAEPLFRAALAALRGKPGNEDIATLDAMSNLATLMQFLGKLDEAEQLARESLETRRRVFGARHPGTLVAVNNLGTLLASRGKQVEAKPYYFESLELSRDVLGPEHADTLTSLANCAGLSYDLGDVVAAERMHREALALRAKTLGDGHADTIDSRRLLARLLMDRGDLEEADQLLSQALAAARSALGDEQPDTLACLHSLGRVRLLQGRAAEAEGLVREAVETSRRTMGPDAWRPSYYALALAEAMIAQAQFELAERELHAAREKLTAALGADHEYARSARRLLVRLYDAWGRGDEARKWRE